MSSSIHPRCVLHLDVDAFLASVEQVHDPTLRGRAVIVGGRPEERSLVMSCSYEARAVGIRPMMHLAEAARIARRAGIEALFVRGSSARGNRARQRLLEVLERYTPLVESTSLDDAYAELSGTELLHRTPPIEIAEKIACDVRRATGLGISQGIGTNRLIARLATRLAKPGGIAYVPPGREEAFVAPFPVGELPGVGRRIGAFLARLGIATAAELRVASRELLVETFGRHGEKLYARCRGREEGAAAGVAEPAGGASRPALPGLGRAVKTVHRETTFAKPTSDPEEVYAMLAYLVDRAAAVVRAMGKRARTIGVVVHHVDRWGREVRRSLREGTEVTALLQEVARELCRGFLTRRVLVRLVGVRLGGLVPAVATTPSLFDERETRQQRLWRAIDRLRGRHGFGRLVAGRAIDLLGQLENRPEGFILRTPSLTQ